MVPSTPLIDAVCLWTARLERPAAARFALDALLFTNSVLGIYVFQSGRLRLFREHLLATDVATHWVPLAWVLSKPATVEGRAAGTAAAAAAAGAYLAVADVGAMYGVGRRQLAAAAAALLLLFNVRAAAIFRG